MRCAPPSPLATTERAASRALRLVASRASRTVPPLGQPGVGARGDGAGAAAQVTPPSELAAASFQQAVAFETKHAFSNCRGSRLFAEVLLEALDASVPQAADSDGAFELSQLRLQAVQYAQLAQGQRQALLAKCSALMGFATQVARVAPASPPDGTEAAAAPPPPAPRRPRRPPPKPKPLYSDAPAAVARAEPPVPEPAEPLVDAPPRPPPPPPPLPPQSSKLSRARGGTASALAAAESAPRERIVQSPMRRADVPPPPPLLPPAPLLLALHAAATTAPSPVRVIELACVNCATGAVFATVVHPGRVRVSAAASAASGVTTADVTAPDVPGFHLAALRLETAISEWATQRPGAPLLLAYRPGSALPELLAAEYSRVCRPEPEGWRFVASETGATVGGDGLRATAAASALVDALRLGGEAGAARLLSNATQVGLPLEAPRRAVRPVVVKDTAALLELADLEESEAAEEEG